MNRDDRLTECFRLLEETGDIERCLAAYPDLRDDILPHARIARSLAALRPGQPPASAVVTSRRLLLSSLTSEPGGMTMPRRFALGRVAASFAALTLLAFGALGASAAAGGPSPLPDVLDSLGVAGGNHGPSVRDAVHEAIDNDQPVGTAARDAAKNRCTLPDPAQDAPGNPAEDCVDGEGQPEGEGAGCVPARDRSTLPPTAQDTPRAQCDDSEQGGAPQAGAEDEGAECAEARDRSTLPPSAQNPPGQEGNGPKDCDGGED